MLRTQAEKNKATGRETGAATFSIMTLEKMTLGITMKKHDSRYNLAQLHSDIQFKNTILGTMTFSIMTLGRITLTRV